MPVFLQRKFRMRQKERVQARGQELAEVSTRMTIEQYDAVPVHSCLEQHLDSLGQHAGYRKAEESVSGAREVAAAQQAAGRGACKCHDCRGAAVTSRSLLQYGLRLSASRTPPSPPPQLLGFTVSFKYNIICRAAVILAGICRPHAHHQMTPSYLEVCMSQTCWMTLSQMHRYSASL